MQRGCCIRPAAKFTLSNASTVTGEYCYIWTNEVSYPAGGKLPASGLQSPFATAGSRSSVWRFVVKFLHNELRRIRKRLMK